MANKQQTAVQMLVEHLERTIGKSIITVMQGSINQALQMEREQIINAHDGFPIESRNCQNGEEYYNLVYSLPETPPAMRELTEQEADILEQTFNNYCKSKNNHSLPDEQPE